MLPIAREATEGNEDGEYDDEGEEVVEEGEDEENGPDYEEKEGQNTAECRSKPAALERIDFKFSVVCFLVFVFAAYNKNVK